VFDFSGAFSYGATVKGTTKWGAVSNRPGGTRQMSLQNTVTGSIEFAVGPRS
jgi:hypothetical protein